MAGAKRQGREKPSKIEQRKVQGPERGPQVAQTALLASPIYIGQFPGGGEKTHKKRSQNARGLSLSLSSLHLFGWMPSWIEDVFSFIF